MQRWLNHTGVFCNLRDDLGALRVELKRRFDDVEVGVVGAVALFSAR